MASVGTIVEVRTALLLSLSVTENACPCAETHVVLLYRSARLQTECSTCPFLQASSHKWRHVPQMLHLARKSCFACLASVFIQQELSMNVEHSACCPSYCNNTHLASCLEPTDMQCIELQLLSLTMCTTVVFLCRTGYTRVIVEKPFGKDSESFRQLSTDLYQHLTEDQMYRIDHYLGKELIENLTVCATSPPLSR